MRARINIDEDLPVARRTSLSRRSSITRFSTLVGITVVMILLTVLAWSNSRNQYSFDGYKPLPDPDGRLLGHFPYEEAEQNELIEVYPGLKIHVDTYNSFNSMQRAASLEGIDLILLSGYRSHRLQKEIFFDIKSSRNQTANERAKVSAPPGYSEHSTGYAIDIGDANRRETDMEVEFETTRAFGWLEQNAARYHFILSFPFGNSQGVSYEPWHWRFEGTAEALRKFEPSRNFNMN